MATIRHVAKDAKKSSARTEEMSVHGQFCHRGLLHLMIPDLDAFTC